MFGIFDNVTLSLVNGTDMDGNIVPFSLRLPVNKDSEYEIPENLASVDIFEYQEGFVNSGIVAFSIYVGEKATIRDLANINDGKRIKLRDEIEIPGVDSAICFQVIGDTRLVYANIEDNDVVVSNHNELRDVIGRLSSDCSLFYDSVEKIKNFYKTYTKE